MLRFCFAAVVFFTTTANAGWLTIDWGSTLDEVVETTHLQVRLATEQETEAKSYPAYGQMLAVADYATPDFTSVAFFLFRDRKLAGVVLDLKDRETAMVARARLMDQYGPPASQSTEFDRGTACTTTQFKWLDAERGNNVSYRGWDCLDEGYASFTLLYTPILTPHQTGL